MDLKIKPIGYFRTSKKFPFDAARQPVFDHGESEGYLELLEGNDFEQALQGLESFSHVWVLYQFHLNDSWSAVVQPPRGIKRGVFATRSPHRPNPIGMSALRIRRIDGRKIYFEAHDILDGSPILDLKPYVPTYDRVDATEGWTSEATADQYELKFSALATSQLEFLRIHGVMEFKNFLQQQLSFEPTDQKKKRVFPYQEKAVIAYRTWRALFKVVPSTVTVEVIYSGYPNEDLENGDDKFNDKALHRDFQSEFPTREDLPKFKAE